MTGRQRRRTARGGSRQPRERRTGGRPLVGAEYDVDVGAVAHGGHCVARLAPDIPEVGGTVVFVRHTLPGERVTVRITEGFVGDRFLRGDAVVVHRASSDRVPQPCSYAGPGLCGGCDFQHVDVAAQRRLKGQVVAEQLRRLAGVDVAVEVEPVPGDVDGLRWRTRMRYHPTPSGGTGLRRHRSRDVLEIDDCLIQAPGARVQVEGEVPDTQPGTETVGETVGETVVETVRGRRFEVAADGFWQVHLGAATTLVDAVLEAARPAPGERVLDLFSGVGLFSVFLAEAVGDRGQVLAVEGDRRAAALAGSNLSAYPWVRVVHGPVDRVLETLTGPRAAAGSAPGAGVDRRDVVVLDPPRTGARRPVVEGVVALAPRAVVYVACDPAALARDVATFAEAGYRLEALRAFDLFPMTHHVEAVALLAQVP